ncbi:MAG: hypothetical protein EBZ54_05710, partial [Actinobacteria bacterium]|nr:hypothetical protein [Actinomycetota bacterium]
MARVVVTGKIPQVALESLRQAHDVLAWEESNPISRAELLTRVKGADALVTLLTEKVDGELLDAAVRGEISGFTRASSGHCYFTLKDEHGQIRCAMFRRAASQLRHPVKDGDQVELTGQLGVYEARGDLQLVVESLRPVGQGALLEAFV